MLTVITLPQAHARKTAFAIVMGRSIDRIIAEAAL